VIIVNLLALGQRFQENSMISVRLCKRN